MNRQVANYQSYLVRFWRMDNAGQPVWRVGLQEPGSDSEVRFESPEALWAYLAAQIGLIAGEETRAHDPPER